MTFGALGDSFYEYLLKVWVQGGKREAQYRRAYDRAMDGMAAKLLQRSSPSMLAYIADWEVNPTGSRQPAGDQKKQQLHPQRNNKKIYPQKHCCEQLEEATRLQTHTTQKQRS